MKKVIMSAIILMFVCCGEVEATDKEEVTNVVKPIETVENPGMYTKYTPVKAVEINLDDMTFTDAFKVQHKAKGEGHVFWWRGEQYTTNLAEITAIPARFVARHVDNADHLGWVRNNDDPDDNCRSNTLDDCGVCDGPGKVTWFRDKDGDGLGTFMEWITSCTYPKPEEIEKYYEESPLEGGGDQGVNR